MSALEDKVNVATLMIIAVVGTVITFVIVMVLRVSYYNMLDTMEAEKGTGRNVVERNEVRAAQREDLGSYGWVDSDAGVARIPIEEAKKKVLESLAD